MNIRDCYEYSYEYLYPLMNIRYHFLYQILMTATNIYMNIRDSVATTTKDT